ncbi:hypothetical protein ACFY7H_30615 [Streptomyces sp. NPDC012794]|uniref:hypothetical protein n=1 Tax=Streptomyces sp. NPDC012794 TaxID=3364850 RepID=UPI003678F9C9
MGGLMRAPLECGAWYWELDGTGEAGVDAALRTAAAMAGVLERHGLLEPVALEWFWVFGDGDARLGLDGVRLDDARLPGRVAALRPAGQERAEPSSFHVVGDGVWFDAAGRERREHRLVELSVCPDTVMGLSAELAVHHDVWGACDFRGVPHPRVYAYNAPRLAAALRELDGLLGVAAEPGEPTYFGTAVGHGLREPDIIDGLGPDLTDLLERWSR